MGGSVAMRQPAAHRRYVALATLGTTNQQVTPLGLPAEMLAAATTPEGRQALLEQIVSTMPDPYLAGERGPLVSWFHLPDVPPAVLLADDGLATVIPRRCAAAGTVPGIGIADAATVDVPVLLAYGDLDVSPAPHLEPSFFTAGRDVTLYRLAGSAHCHNSATTRARLWDRLLAWAGTVA